MGWSTENLGDLYKIGSSKRVLKSQWQTSGVPFYRGREITALSKYGEVSNELFISEALYQEYSKKHGVPTAEDIVITAIGTIGNAYIVSEEDRFYFKDASVLWLKRISNVDSSFINLWLKSPLMREQLDEGNGATVDTLTIKKLQSLQVKLPPISEQQRIVAILDQAFADIEKARANAEKNLKNARELFDSYLQQVYSNNDYSQFPLGEVIDILTDYHANGSYKVLKQHVELKKTEDYAWMVRSTDFEKEFKNEKRYIGESAYKYLKKTPLFGGEIIMSKIGNAGKVYFMPETNRPCSLAMNLFLIRLNKEIANNEYVFRYLNSSIGKSQIMPLLNGAATQTITKDSVRSLKIPLPRLEEQAKVVIQLNKLEKQIHSLEEVYKSKINAIEELRLSTLHKAFTGELTKSKGMAA